MKDLRLDPYTHDFVVGGPVVEDKEHVAQSLKIRLLFFLGEWFLDLTAGVGYYQDVLKKHPRGIAAVDALFKAQILATPGVRKLLEFKSNWDKGARRYDFTFAVDTIYGELRAVVQSAQNGGPSLPVIVITDNVVVHG